MSEKLPIVFSPGYDITLLGLEKLHPFDSAKYGKIFQLLSEKGVLAGHNHHQPAKASETTLLKVHTPAYLKHLRSSKIVGAIAEIPQLKWVPNFILRAHLLKPMALATQGSIDAINLAWQHGWAINLAGGYHHAKANISSGFCFYSDIPLAAYDLLDKVPNIRIMVLDLDAHQGNGFEAVFKDDPRIINFDVYNGAIYPQDHEAAAYIHYNFPLKPRTSTKKYLDLIKKELPKALDKEKPDLVIYNAGSDIYENDPLGGLSVSAEGICERDLFVFQETLKKRCIPTLMLLSGGYVQDSYQVIGNSIYRFLTELELLTPASTDQTSPV
ncbi:UNVERIFIED_CONTAM: hypothetical protein GTU68_003476 [Idotea baltica]|nr:hypothetical protein [Idotea baltica]